MFATIAVLIFSAATVPQAVTRGVAIAGVVRDQNGAVVPDAKVSLAADGSSTQPRTIVSDATGSFRFDLVAPGSFVIQVEFPGFKTVSIHVRVGIRPPSPQTIVLEIEGLTQELSVTTGGEASADASNNLNAIAVDASTLDNLPVLDGDVVGPGGPSPSILAEASLLELCAMRAPTFLMVFLCVCSTAHAQHPAKAFKDARSLRKTGIF